MTAPPIAQAPGRLAQLLLNELSEYQLLSEAQMLLRQWEDVGLWHHTEKALQEVPSRECPEEPVTQNQEANPS